MPGLRCPRCGAAFPADGEEYAKLADQVRDEEFSREVEERTRRYEEERSEELARLIVTKNTEIADLRARSERYERERAAGGQGPAGPEQAPAHRGNAPEANTKNEVIAGLRERIAGNGGE